MTNLQEKLKDGTPVDERHPGKVNLTPLQYDMFSQLLNKERAGESLNPEAEKRLHDLKDSVVQGQPLDTTHSGMNHLTPG